MTLASKLEKLPSRIKELMAETSVPGVSLAVMHHDEVYETAAGYVNLSAKIEATTDSVFQIGSITKLFTTTLILQLIDEGKLNLDEKVNHYLPEFQLADNEASEIVTLRQLLTHTSGMDGDFFEDTAKGNDCVERFVLACRALPQLHPPGKMFSYCNSGFVIAGRIIEKTEGKPWHEVLRQRIIHPMELHPMGTEPEEAILNRASVGHMPNPESGEQMMIPAWRLPVSNGPAGATPFATARNLMAFARVFLNGGKNAAGEEMLSGTALKSIQDYQTDIPDSVLGFNGLGGWGIGWMIFDWDGTRLIGHDGATIGQNAYFRMVPNEKLAVAFMTNGGDSAAFSQSLLSEVIGELAGIKPPPIPKADPNLEVDLSKYCGTYQRLSVRLTVTMEKDGLVVTTTGLRPPFNLIPPIKASLEPVNPELFLARSPASVVPASANFLNFDTEGIPGYLHLSGRAARRVS